MPNPIQAKITRLCNLAEAQHAELRTLRIEQLRNKTRQAKTVLAKAVADGKIAPKDDKSKGFWLRSLMNDPKAASAALDALPSNPVLAKVTRGGSDPKSGLLDKMALQKKKLAEVQATNPQADFQTIFAKAQSEAPDLFR